MLLQNTSFKKGFKFDNVWPILKDIEKYIVPNKKRTLGHRKQTTPNEMSQPESQKSDKSIELSSFCILI